MTIESLSSITLATIENYRAAANRATHAYRVGSQRLIGALNTSLEQNIDGRVNKLAPEFGSSMLKVRNRVTDIVVKGIDGVTNRTEKAVDLGSDNAVKQVNKVAEFAAGVENQIVANGLQTAARLSLPGAKVALAVSSKVADGAKALSGAVQGKAVKPAAEAVKPAAEAVINTVTRVATGAKRKTAKTVRTAVAAPKKAAVRAKRKLA